MVIYKVTNLKEFEARFTSSVNALGAGAIKAMEQEAKKFYSKISKKVERSIEYKQLMTNHDIRGILGMPAPGRRFGSDTDGPDLLIALSKFKSRRADVRGSSHRRFVITFPTLQQLEQTLTRNLSRVEGGIPKPGLRTSWFRWWEFGDRGEIEGQTILKSRLAGVRTRDSRGRFVKSSRKKLLTLIRERSRSLQAIQLINNPGGVKGFQGVGLIGRIYAEFAQEFRPHMEKAVRAFLGRTTRNRQFFANVTIR